jgi:putative membrane protein
MDRRTALGCLAAGSLPGSVAYAQTKPGEIGPVEQTHINQTIEVGFVSFEASKIALAKAEAVGVKRFAQAEALEQQNMASVLKLRVGLRDIASPQMSAEAKSAIERLRSLKTGLEFDKAYVADQIEGHRKLLQIQENYLSNGKDMTQTSIAMLSGGHVKEHLINLEILQKVLAS